jgi:hypothetical protein
MAFETAKGIHDGGRISCNSGMIIIKSLSLNIRMAKIWLLVCDSRSLGI